MQPGQWWLQRGQGLLLTCNFGLLSSSLPRAKWRSLSKRDTFMSPHYISQWNNFPSSLFLLFSPCSRQFLDEGIHPLSSSTSFCVCVHIEDVGFDFPLVTGYFLLCSCPLPLPSTTVLLQCTHSSAREQKGIDIWGTYLHCYVCKHEGYFIPIFPFNFHLLIQQWIHLWPLKPGLLGLHWQFTEDCEGGGKSPFLSTIFIGLPSQLLSYAYV